MYGASLWQTGTSAVMAMVGVVSPGSVVVVVSSGTVVVVVSSGQVVASSVKVHESSSLPSYVQFAVIVRWLSTHPLST